ncbi:MAG TPA: type II secretion system minor pseudopilin GspH [Steroidobacteraceae bacterium]|nr:type II secretion system minor pseudopilin GspH [Steroidobacteraceae bacterium]
MRTALARSRSRGFTLIEIMIVVVIIGVISAGVLLSVNLTGKDHDLDKESERLLTLVNYAREQAEIQTREYGVIFHEDGYQFVAYDTRRQRWREVYEDEILRLRKLPDGLDVKLIVDARPVVLVPTSDVKPSDPKDRKPQAKSVKDVSSLKDAVSAGRKMGEDTKSTLDEAKKIAPQVTIFSNGDLSSFEVTIEREGGIRSVTIAIDEKGKVIEKPMVETRT